MRKLTSMLLALAVAGGAAACAHRQEPPRYIEDGAEAGGSTTVQVVSQYNLPLDIWAVSGGARTRLGSVGAGSSESYTLDLRAYPNAFVEIMARQPGGQALASSGRIGLREGRVIRFEIDSNPRFSRATVQ